VAVDGQTEVRVDLRSTGRVPSGGLLLEDGVPYALGGKPRFVVEMMPRHGSVQLRYPLNPKLRGIQQVGPLLARTTDPFGLAEFDRELAGKSRLIVVPRVYELEGLPSGSGLGAGEDGSLRLQSGQGDHDAIVRQYRQGDDLRKVHWKSTARRDELMVRVEEIPWRGGCTVLVDHRATAHRGAGTQSSLEWGISLAASICLHLHRHGHEVRLVTEDGHTLAGGSVEGGHDDDAVLDALAGLQPSHRRDLTCASDPGRGQELIAVLGGAGAAAAGELVRQRPRGARNVAILLDTRGWVGIGDDPGVDPAAAVTALRNAGWVVAVATVDTSPADVWAAISRAGSAPTRPAFEGLR
jgi:uncharacterized protein (DUF58 family)